MQTHMYTLTGTGSYEFETAGDCYSFITIAPTGTAEYYVEISNGGGIWVNHPNLLFNNPQTGLNLGQLAATCEKMRVRATVNDATIPFAYYAAELDR